MGAWGSEHGACTRWQQSKAITQSPHTPPTKAQAAQLPGDRALLEQAREAAAALLAEQPDPRQWSKELLALVADDSLLELDTLELPSMA